MSAAPRGREAFRPFGSGGHPEWVRNRSVNFPQFETICPPFQGDGSRRSSRVGRADRAALYDFRRFPTLIPATFSPLVGHQPRSWDHPLARRAREDRLRAPDPDDCGGTSRVGGGGLAETAKRGRPSVTESDGSLKVLEPLAEQRMVGQGTRTGAAGAEAAARLALASAQVCQRPDGSAAQGAVRARRLEVSPHRASVLSETERGTAPGSTRQPPPNSDLKPLGGNKTPGIQPIALASSVLAIG